MQERLEITKTKIDFTLNLYQHKKKLSIKNIGDCDTTLNQTN